MEISPRVYVDVAGYPRDIVIAKIASGVVVRFPSANVFGLNGGIGVGFPAVNVFSLGGGLSGSVS